MKNQNSIAENKSALAKLLASENITVRHSPKATTAYFDLKRRVLTCPVWDSMDLNIYDLLMGHEISHALHTPEKGWHDAIIRDTTRKNIKHFLNVIEDARIERLIKEKYPGIRKPFFEAYQTLNERDLFGVKKMFRGDYSKMNLIDRINLHFKLGSLARIEFSDEEQVFVDRTATAKTWTEVEQIARDIYDFLKIKQQENKKSSKNQKPEKGKKEKSESESDEDGSDISEESEEGSGESDSFDDNDSNSEEDEEDSDSSGTSADIESDEEKDSKNSSKKEASSNEDDSNVNGNKGASGDNTVIEPRSHTDEIFRSNEISLIDRSQKFGIEYFSLPEAKLENIIIPYDVVQKTFRDYTKQLVAFKYDVVASTFNEIFDRRNKNVIALMVKEFELHKNASQYKRQMVSKTGILDNNKLSRYKFSNDIFRRMTTVDKGKNHGMILFLDLSSSMDPIIDPIIEQLLILVTFCKKVGVPFDVYAFTDSNTYINYAARYDKFKYTQQSFKFANYGNFCLRHLISSEMTANEYREAFSMLNFVGLTISKDKRNEVKDIIKRPFALAINSGISYGGTPFCETLVASKQIIEKFKIDKRVDITNVIYLTDGEGNPSVQTPFNDIQQNYQNTNVGFFDEKTKIKVDAKNNQIQSAITNLISQVTECNHFGYYFGKDDQLSVIIESAKENGLITIEEMKSFKKELSEDGVVAFPNLGYKNYYYVDVNTLKLRDKFEYGQIPQKSNDKTHQQILNKFIENSKKLKKSLVLVKRFAKEIAE